MKNPYAYYRLETAANLRRGPARAVRELDWHRDLALIRRFYSRFTDVPIDPGTFDRAVGNPLAILSEGEIVSFAIPLSFRAGETEIGGVATVPEHRNEGLCKALIAELASRILARGLAATLTTEQTNLPMRSAAESIGMKQIRHDAE